MLGVSDDLYKELWKACAGPLVDVPQSGERVFYFPQGHMEQVRNFHFYSSLCYCFCHVDQILLSFFVMSKVCILMFL